MPDGSNNALGEFLRSRRQKLAPETVGLASSHRRRAAGLRREEVAERAGIGAAVGGIIGAIAGGGKGAAIGAGVGAGAGTGVQMATKAPSVKIPPETSIDFTLSSPLRVTVNQ